MDGSADIEACETGRQGQKQYMFKGCTFDFGLSHRDILPVYCEKEQVMRREGRIRGLVANPNDVKAKVLRRSFTVGQAYC